MLKKVILSVFILILTISCTLKKADTEYKRGNYLKSSRLLFSYLDKNIKKIEKIDNNTKNDIINKFTHIINYYKFLSENSNNRLEILESNKALIEIYSLINTREYTKKNGVFVDFVNETNIIHNYDKVKENVQYLFENSIYTNQKTSLDYIKYLDEIENFINNLIQKNNNSNYYMIKNDINILRGHLYRKYGIKLYNLGMEEIRNNNLKKKYRIANNYFLEAKKYIPYYDNIDFMIKETEEKGFFSYSLYTNNPKINSYIIRKMYNIGKIDYGRNAEIYINYNDDNDYSINRIDRKIENLIENKKIGINKYGEAIYKIYKYRKITLTEKEILKINYKISITGKYLQDYYSDYLTVENTINSVFYDGDVPSEYKSSSENPLGKEKLIEKAYDDLENKLNYYFNAVINALEKF